MKMILYFLFVATLIIFSTSCKKRPTDPVVEPDQLIAYWSFDDGTAKDQSGNGYDGTFVNNPITVPGINGKGKAIFFQGDANWVVCPETPSGSHMLIPRIPFERYQEFTLSMLVFEKNMEYYAGEAYISFGAHSDRWLGIYNHNENSFNTRKLAFAVGGNVLYDVIDTLVDLKNKWMYYCMVYKQDILSVFINGQKIGSIKQGINIQGDFNSIARHYWYYKGELRSSAFFTGMIDEVKIYKTALCDSAIYKLYNTP